MSDSFGARLRYERERRQIALRSIAEGTKISAGLLEGLERDDVSRWPSGIFRKSFVRAYAEAIGLDPDPVVREFVERYPDPLEVDVVAPVTSSSSSFITVRSSFHQAHHHLERVGTSHHWKIGGLEDCQNVVGSIVDQQSLNPPICQSSNVIHPT